MSIFGWTRQTSSPRRRGKGMGSVAAAVLFLAGCAGNPALEDSRRLIAEGRVDEGIRRLEQASREDPDDRELRSRYFRQRELVIGQLLASAEDELAARRLDAAQALYERVLRLDPASPRARTGLSEVAAERRHQAALREAEARLGQRQGAEAERILRTVLTESPAHGEARRLLRQAREQTLGAETPAQTLQGPFAKPITLEFRDAPLKTVFEVIARSSGINFAFDKDVKSEAKVTVFVRNSSLDDVVKLILATSQLERKLLNENSVLIYPNTAAKAKEYQNLAVKSFYLANADAKQVMTMLKTVLKSKDAFVDEKLNLLVVRDTPEAIRLAEQLIESVDLAEPEVMLELEVLEISRNRLLELGLRFPDQISYGKITPDVTNKVLDTTGNTISETTTFGGALAPGFIDLRHRDSLTSFVINPALLLNLKSQDGDSNLLANPRIRVKNHEKAKVHIGDKLPVFTTTSTANVGVSASVSYLDVGLKLDVEPTIYLEDEVAIKVGLEVSSVVKEVPGPSNSLAYQVGTRSAATTLRLKNGETQVLAGLISDEERNSANKLPGLGDIPLFGRLFSSHKDTHAKTEIVLLVTPRIIRNLVRPQPTAPALPSGTEAAVGAPALTLKPTAPRSFSLSSQPAPGGPHPAREAAPADEAPAAAAETLAPAPEAPAAGVPQAPPDQPIPAAPGASPAVTP